jgi:hypothetical protein
MWVEAIIARSDLDRCLHDFCPMRMVLRDGGSLVISEPRDVELHPGVGLRVSVTVELHWPILGIPIPVSARSVTLEVKPEVVRTDTADLLVFRFRFLDIDLAIFPSFADHSLVNLLNEELAAKHVELSWNFTRTLSHDFELPAALTSARALGLRATWGAVRVTTEALVLAVSFHAAVEPTAKDTSPTTTSMRVVSPAGSDNDGARHVVRTSNGSVTLVAGGLALLAGLGVSAILYGQLRHETLLDRLRHL